MVVPPEHLAVAFANTRSSSARDRIAEMSGFQAWAAAWPAIAPSSQQLHPADLVVLGEQRDATQFVLVELAAGRRPDQAAVDRATGTGLDQAPFALRSADEGLVLVSTGDPCEIVSHVLARATVDFLLTPGSARLHRCEGAHCRKVFVSTRASRRWCDPQICGNRARVAAHARRQSGGAAS